MLLECLYVFCKLVQCILGVLHDQPLQILLLYCLYGLCFYRLPQLRKETNNYTYRYMINTETQSSSYQEISTSKHKHINGKEWRLIEWHSPKFEMHFIYFHRTFCIFYLLTHKLPDITNHSNSHSNKIIVLNFKKNTL